VPAEFVQRRNVLPLMRAGDRLVVAIGNPFDVSVVDDVQTLTGIPALAVLAYPDALAPAIQAHLFTRTTGDAGRAQQQDYARKTQRGDLAANSTQGWTSGARRVSLKEVPQRFWNR
jgi:hypothetical protein